MLVKQAGILAQVYIVIAPIAVHMFRVLII